MKTTGKALAEHYKLNARSAHYHVSGRWYWTLEKFPGVYFDANGYLLFLTKRDYSGCEYLRIGPVNTGVRNKEAGISGIPGYVRRDPTLVPNENRTASIVVRNRISTWQGTKLSAQRIESPRYPRRIPT